MADRKVGRWRSGTSNYFRTRNASRVDLSTASHITTIFFFISHVQNDTFYDDTGTHGPNKRSVTSPVPRALWRKDLKRLGEKEASWMRTGKELLFKPRWTLGLTDGPAGSWQRVHSERTTVLSTGAPRAAAMNLSSAFSAQKQRRAEKSAPGEENKRTSKVV